MIKIRVLKLIAEGQDGNWQEAGLSISQVANAIPALISEGLLTVNDSEYTITEKGYEYMLSSSKKENAGEVKQIRQAVILAAGERKEFDKPAALLTIEDIALLERNITILEEQGIEKIIICTGFASESFKEQSFLTERTNVSFVENPRYLWTGSMATLAAAAGEVSEDFILIEDDILIEEKAIQELLKSKENDCLLVTQESGSGDEAFIETEGGYITKISKDIHQLNHIDGELIGISKISYESYMQMVKVFEQNKNPFLNYEYMFLAVSGTISFLKLTDIIWAEIDNQQDYFKVLDKIYPLLKKKEADFKEAELKQLIAGAMRISAGSVSAIEPLGGLTNQNFKVTVDGNDYAVRVPGKGTEHYINRGAEKINSGITSRIGINPNVVHFNEHTGLKIVEYIPEAETLNPKTGKREDNLAKVANVFSALHNSGEVFTDRFDVFEKITEYEEVLDKLKGKLFNGHDEVKKQVLELEDFYRSLNVKLAPCHNDPLAENFIKSGEEKMYLIDWEFSGMNDPYWDIAAYIIEAELSQAEESLFLLEYFKGNVTEENLQRVLINKIFLDFLWTIWALMKEAGGEDFGSYAFTRFTRAQENLALYKKQYKGSESIAKN
ncbi:NTP transferase domain-containing protein [Mesobacillus selenatarsenatis]|uniref:Phosphotransferase n=1 Tax=Mesobacillus selenatarsenatis TaxID=388741 RepID=A0A846TN54_9BACI|nr:NTP transferase domain-containing protein [Mesobacillus selenatarsenatis]NKE08209.1 phosphotransferase [Mesobacillus selenatarsenatis]